jgi:hypothetical protein
LIQLIASSYHPKGTDRKSRSDCVFLRAEYATARINQASRRRLRKALNF